MESSPGRGTTFRVDLPASEKTVPRQEEEKEVLPAGGGRILVMDDDEAIRDVTGEMLRKWGYEVGFARDGDEAIEAYVKALKEGHPYRAAILDLTVPGGAGGVEAARKLRELDPKVRLIVSSGYSNDPVLSNPGPYGFLGVIRKPFEEGEIGKTVRDVLRRSRVP